MRVAIDARVRTRDKQDTENQLAQPATSPAPGTGPLPASTSIDAPLFWSLDRLTRGGALETLSALNRLVAMHHVVQE
jgi:hypothetical protein